jgi:hydroxyacylglutathione hydrolase
MIRVQSFVNTPIDSITYIISNSKNSEALVIDPGTENDERIIYYLTENNFDLKFIFLTHEHFDHILGVNYLRFKFQNVKVISSEKTSERLSNPKKNLSVFHNQINLVVNKSEMLVKEGGLRILGLNFEVFETPGHTDSSICLKFKNLFFSGDFLLSSTRIVTNLPTGSKNQYQESVNKNSNKLNGLTIFPGHGEIYVYNQLSTE